MFAAMKEKASDISCMFARGGRAKAFAYANLTACQDGEIIPRPSEKGTNVFSAFVKYAFRPLLPGARFTNS
jgi:hypothetical protein